MPISPSATGAPARPLRPSQRRPLWQSLALWTLCLLGACWLGIVSRPLDFLAAFWPANALALGLMLRLPHLARLARTWVLGFAVYVAADWLTGASWQLALLLNAANWVGIAAGWLYLRRTSLGMLHFQNQRAVVHLFNACVLASLSCMVVGAWPSSQGFGVPLQQSALLWFSSEFYNYVLILPVFLAAPSTRRAWRENAAVPLQWSDATPLLVLLACEALSWLVPGHGTIAFIMPAMVWCAMRYGVLATAVISLLLCTWKAAAMVLLGDVLHFGPSHVSETMSYRVGLALLSLAPLAVACAEALRKQVMAKLHHSVNHDYLTGALTRRAWMERGQRQLQRLRELHQPLAVLMLDLDYFKQINDNYGHAQGDAVLQGFVSIAQQHLRPEDLLGRMGGEEFALLLPNTTTQQALAVGERLCEGLRRHSFVMDGGAVLQATTSIGLYAVPLASDVHTLDALLSHADAALYAAKNAGRDQVKLYGPPSHMPPLAPALHADEDAAELARQLKSRAL